MRQMYLRVVLCVIGIALVAGALTHFLPPRIVPATLRPLDSYVGTEGSIIGGVFGVGVCRAALELRRYFLIVWLTVAYAFSIAVFEVVAHFTIGRTVSLAPIVFGLGSGALLLALIFPRAVDSPEPRTAEPEEAPVASHALEQPEAQQEALEPAAKNLR
jgi:hypothetical protein